MDACVTYLSVHIYFYNYANKKNLMCYFQMNIYHRFQSEFEVWLKFLPMIMQ